MRFLLDENFPKAVIPILEARRHEVFDFRDVGTEGAPDREVLEEAIERKAAVLTTDRDFFHTHGQTAPGHFGIVVVALKQPTRAAIVGRLEWFLDHLGVESLPGRTFQLRDRTWVVYPPLDESTHTEDSTGSSE